MADSIPLAAPLLKTEAPWRERLFPNNEWVLLVVLLIECSVFSVTGNNFLSTSNAFEITRLSVEIGLLALALTPIIISGGIDLSVGLDDGAGSGCNGGPVARRSFADDHRDRCGAGCRLARRRAERLDDRAAEVSAFDRHTGNVFTVSRHG